MSITSTDLITYAVGDGTTGTISTPPFESASDIVVLVRADGEDTVSTWVLDTDYTLTGAGTGTNGTLTPITTKPVDAVIVIYTDPASTLTFDFSALPSALQSPLKSALHQLSLQVRSLKAQQRQVIKTSIFDLVSQNNAGQAAIDTDRLGKLLLWNASTGAPDVIDPADVTGSFVELTDTPSSFSGAGGYHVKVNSGATALEFVATPAVYDQFTDLTDTPASYSGIGGRLLRVNAGETAVEAFTYDAPNLGRDGRTILEAGSITDASAEFLSGGTFTLDPTNARHYNIQVGDSTTPLTAAMTIDLVPDSTLWPDTAQLIITKGSSDAYNITLSGLNADGLGTVTLVDQYEGVILGYHHTDGANGPGAAGQKWKIVARLRPVNAPESPSAEYPEGTSVVRIRDSNGDVAQVGNASDGTIIIDDEIRAVAKLGPTTVAETAVTASRLLTISDIQYEIVTGEGLPSAVTERTLVCLADPASTPIALTIGNTAGATRNWPILILVDPDQTGAVTLALVENGTINGVAGTGTWQFYANRPTPILIRNPTGTAPIVTTGAMIEDGKATILSDDGTLTVAEHNQRIILATDDVTVPAIVGLQGVIVASGASRDVTFGTDTIAVPDGAMLPFVVLTATSWLRPPDPIENAVGDGS